MYVMFDTVEKHYHQQHNCIQILEKCTEMMEKS